MDPNGREALLLWSLRMVESGGKILGGPPDLMNPTRPVRFRLRGASMIRVWANITDGLGSVVRQKA